MSMICQPVHRLELLKFSIFYVPRLLDKREIRTKFNFGHAYPKCVGLHVRNLGLHVSQYRHYGSLHVYM